MNGQASPRLVAQEIVTEISLAMSLVNRYSMARQRSSGRNGRWWFFGG